MTRTACIVGAGVIGVTSAYALARKGWSVTLVDGADGPAMGTSHANGGQLSYCYTDALGSPWTMASLPRLVFGDGGIKIGLGMKPDYLAWLASFARNCTLSRFRQNTLEVLRLALESRRAMEELCQRHALDFEHRQAGKINLLYSRKECERAELVRAIKAGIGCEQDIVGREDFASLDAGLESLDSEAIAAVSTPSEVVGDPLLFCRELLGVLEREYAVQTRFGSSVKGFGKGRVELASGEELSAELVVVAAGTASNRLLAPHGERVPVQPMKGYSFEMPATPRSPTISVTDGKRRIVFTRLGDRMRVAGIAELGNASREIDAARIEWMVSAAKECLPQAGDYSQVSGLWSGLRPTTPNSQPIIRRAGKWLAINTGHGALGWTLAMGSAERLAAMVED